MTTSRQRIGFDRELELGWLDATAAFVADGSSPAETRSKLDQLLQDRLGGNGGGGHRGKTVTVLTRIWSNVPEECIPLRDDAIEQLARVDEAGRLGLHWAMTTAVYPFFNDVCTTVGRLLALQGEVTRAAVLSRMQQSWGDRPAVSRATRAVWTSVVNWGTLSPLSRKGQYAAPARVHEMPGSLTEALTESLAIAVSPKPLSLTEAQAAHGHYPFQLTSVRQAVKASHRLALSREGSDLDLIRIRHAGDAPHAGAR